MGWLRLGSLLLFWVTGAAGQDILIKDGGREIAVPLPDGNRLSMVWIEPGTFKTKLSYLEGGGDQQHCLVVTEGFYIGKYEVTQGQWEGVLGSKPWVGQPFVKDNPSHPAVYLSWNAPKEFIQRLNGAANGVAYSLPTEVEWEYACRADTESRWSFGDTPDLLQDYAWFRGNAWDAGLRWAQPVGTKLANPWGLHDMHGNVWEWVYSGQTVEAEAAQSYMVSVTRGGCFGTPALGLSSEVASRFYWNPENWQGGGRQVLEHGAAYVGFRLLRKGPKLTGPTAVARHSWGQVKDGNTRLSAP